MKEIRDVCIWTLELASFSSLIQTMETSKTHRVQAFLPRIRPSFLSVILTFTCAVLWFKYEATNSRLSTLEEKIMTFCAESRNNAIGFQAPEFEGTPIKQTITEKNMLKDYQSLTQKQFSSVSTGLIIFFTLLNPRNGFSLWIYREYSKTLGLE